MNEYAEKLRLICKEDGGMEDQTLVYCECDLCEAAFEIECQMQEARKWRAICERFAESDPKFDAFLAYFKEVLKDGL